MADALALRPWRGQKSPDGGLGEAKVVTAAGGSDLRDPAAKAPAERRRGFAVHSQRVLIEDDAVVPEGALRRYVFVQDVL